MNLFTAIYSAMCILSKIKYMEYPVCKTCIHFLPDENIQRCDEFSRCKLFGEKNVVTGEIKYKLANICRMYDDYCNITGRYHELAE
jgi:hypothetical protein